MPVLPWCGVAPFGGMTMPSATASPCLSGRVVPAVAAACWLVTFACPCVAAEPLGRGLEAACRLTGTAGCRCSFATVETVLSFAEAADLLLGYYQTIPHARYPVLLDRLLRQCAGEATYPEADTSSGLPVSAGPLPGRTAWRP